MTFSSDFAISFARKSFAVIDFNQLKAMKAVTKALFGLNCDRLKQIVQREMNFQRFNYGKFDFEIIWQRKYTMLTQIRFFVSFTKCEGT